MPWPTYLHELCGRDHDDLWSDVIERVRTHPHEAAVQGNFGQTALHVASYRYPPLGAVEAILAARPECTTLVNNSGETPLHLATDHSEEDVQLAILQCGPKAASMRDKYGDTPLHLACSSGDATSERFVDELLLACTDAVHMKNKAGVLPMFKLPLREEYDETGRYILHESQSDSNSKKFRFEEDDENYKIVMKILKVGMFRTFRLNFESSGWIFRELHAVAAMPCPIDVVEAAITKFPEQAKDQDHDGMTALAYAAKADIQYGPIVSKDVRSEANRVSKKSFVVDSILSLNYLAAEIPDKYGRYPLHHALINGKTFHEGVSSILNAAPRVAQVKDSQTGLYPFMMPTLFNAKRSHNESEEVIECRYLETCYKLIRIWPECVRLLDKDINTSDFRESHVRDKLQNKSERINNCDNSFHLQYNGKALKNRVGVSSKKFSPSFPVAETAPNGKSVRPIDQHTSPVQKRLKLV